VASKEFLFCSLLLWQIGLILYILLNKFYGKTVTSISSRTENQDTKMVSMAAGQTPFKKAVEHVDIATKKSIIMEKPNISSIKSDEEIKGKVSTQKDKLKQLRRS
tara:strand:- start:365 stop:679 length:315 start_codon:yes stop_codon:yes gene_type:complete